MSIVNQCRSQIAKMATSDPLHSLIRVGDIWHGDDDLVTVANVIYFANKNIVTIQGLRTEAALSYSNSNPPVDTIQMELVVHYSRFKSHVQRLFALVQITPVLPVMNPVIAAITQPMGLNKPIYRAYGISHMLYDNPGSQETAALMRAYSSVPVMMKIDNIHLESIDQAPRDLRIILRVTRVLTANTYGDRVEYVKDMKSATIQDEYMHDIVEYRKDSNQIDSLSRMLGINVPDMRRMIEEIRRPAPGIPSGEKNTAVDGKDFEALGGDLFKFKRVGQISRGATKEIATIYGIDTAIGPDSLKQLDNATAWIPQKGWDKSRAVLAKLFKDHRNNITITVMGKDSKKLMSPSGRSYRIIVGNNIDVGEYMIKHGYAYPALSMVSNPSNSLWKSYGKAWDGLTGKEIEGIQGAETDTGIIGGNISESSKALSRGRIKKEVVASRKSHLPGYTERMWLRGDIYNKNSWDSSISRFLPPDKYREQIRSTTY